MYTQEIIDRIRREYLESPSLETARRLADEIGVTERSIVAKLSAMGIYKRKTYTTKMGGPPIKKDVYIDRISKLLDIDVCLLDSLEKVTKQALILMVDRIEKLHSKK